MGPTTPRAADTRMIPQIVAGLVTETTSEQQCIRVSTAAHALPMQAPSRLASIDPLGTAIIWDTAPAEPSTWSTLSPRSTPRKMSPLTGQPQLLRQSGRTTDSVGHRAQAASVPGIQLQPVLEFLDIMGVADVHSHAQPADVRLRRAPQPVLLGELRCELLRRRRRLFARGCSRVCSMVLLHDRQHCRQHRRGYPGFLHQRELHHRSIAAGT